jgi:type II secretion system protein H
MDVWETMMIFPTGKMRIRRNKPGRAQAFTLIELILVMALLLIVIAVASPTLSHFFRGRNLDSEARRFLSLTRYGQSRAVSEGIPMKLWVDVANETYGLQQEAGYAEEDKKAVDFRVDKDLKLGIAEGTTTVSDGHGVPAIHFLPDGTIGTTGAMGVSFQENDGRTLWLVPAGHGLKYEIQDQNKNTIAGR